MVNGSMTYHTVCYFKSADPRWSLVFRDAMPALGVGPLYLSSGLVSVPVYAMPVAWGHTGCGMASLLRFCLGAGTPDRRWGKY